MSLINNNVMMADGGGSSSKSSSSGGGNGVTGLNPAKAQNEIREIGTSIERLQSKMVSSTDIFFDDLSMFWNSPKAVEFESNALPMITEAINQIGDFKSDIVKKCEDAYNALARSNGESVFVFVDYSAMHVLFHRRLHDADTNGAVGMVIANVTECLDKYVNSCRDIVTMLDEVPTSISFYDTDGSIVSSYKTGVNTLKTKIEENITKVSELVKQNIVEEQTNVKSAVVSATSELQV